MILFNNDFLFVHNPKTAGTSLLDYFHKVLPGPIHIAGVQEIGTYHPHLGISLEYATAKLGGTFKRILAVTRNPYSREVSMYFHFRDRVGPSAARSQDLNSPLIEKAVLKSMVLDFRPYIEWLWNEFGTCDIWDSSRYYQLDDHSTPKTMRVISMENIAAELPAAMAGFTKPEAQGVTLTHVNTTEHAPFEAYYDARSEQLVAASYLWQLQGGQYEFLNRGRKSTKGS